MKCTKKQADRINDILNELNIYMNCSVEFEDGVIEIHTGYYRRVETFDDAMQIIMQLSELDSTKDEDYLTEEVCEILESADDEDY